MQGAGERSQRKRESGMPIDDSELDKITGIQLATPVAPVCPQCHYNLTGLVDPLCPECGHRFDWKSVRRKARVAWLEALGLKTLPEEIEFGFWITWIAWGVAILINGSMALMRTFHILSFPVFVLFIVLLMAQLLMAFCGVFLCSHIVKFRQLAEEAREELRIDVPEVKAWVGLVASAVLLLVSLPVCAGIVVA
jgi:hypothetical protein